MELRLRDTETWSVIQSKVTGEDSKELGWTVSLICPLTKKRMEIPIRSCDHLQCFDGPAFAETIRTSKKWKCPLCSKAITQSDLGFDQQLLEILHSTPETCEQVQFRPDGSWIQIYKRENYEIIDIEEEIEKEPVITVKGRKPRKKADKEPEVSPQSDGGDELDEPVDDEETGKQVGGRNRGAKKTAKQTKAPSKSAKASASDDEADEAPKEKKAPAKKATRTAKGKKAASKKEDLNQDNSEPEDIREEVESKPEPEVEKAPEPEVTAKGKRLRKKASKDPEPSSEKNTDMQCRKGYQDAFTEAFL